MPRRRKIEIKASELECFDILAGELRTREEFSDLDTQSIRVWAYENYEQELKNADKALYNLDRWLAVHRNETFLTSTKGDRLLTKKELAKALGITRPTLDRWLGSVWMKECRNRTGYQQYGKVRREDRNEVGNHEHGQGEHHDRFTVYP